MIVSPYRIINEKWLTHPKMSSIEDFKKHNHLSPNAIDVTLDRAFLLSDNDHFSLSETKKEMRSSTELFPTLPTLATDPMFSIPPNTCIDAMSHFYVKVPQGYSAWLIVRSSLNRNGLFVTSGWYDQGFEGNVGFMIHNNGPRASIAPGTRVAQLIFTTAEDSNILYAGGYNHEQGTHWSGAAEGRA